MSEADLLNKIATLLENQLEEQRQTRKVTEDLLNGIATLLEKQWDDQRQAREAAEVGQKQKDAVQLYSGLSVVGSIIASLSLSLLSYAATLAQADALSNDALFTLDLIWFTTTGTSLFLAGSTGIVAAIFGAVNPENLIKKVSKKSRWNSPRWSDGFVIVCLFVVLLTMIAGLIVLSNDNVIKTPGGDTRLPATVLYPLFAVTVIVTIILVYWMVHTRYKRPGPNLVPQGYAGETT